MKPLNLMTKNEKFNFLNFIEKNQENYLIDYYKEFEILIKDSNIQIRKKVIDLLWNIPSADFLNYLFDIAKNDPIIDVKNKAISALGKYIYDGIQFNVPNSVKLDISKNLMEGSITYEEYMEIKKYLITLYNDETKTIDERRFALEALSYSFEEDIQIIIREAYNSSHRLMKKSAILAMGRNGLSHWQNILLLEIENPDDSIQCEAIKAIGEMKLINASKKVLDFTYSEDIIIAKAAIKALGQIGWEGAFERLDELTKIDNEEIKELSKKALKEWYINNNLNQQLY